METDREEMYCLLCHGRGLDQQDHTCGRCHGTGYEPDTYDIGRGPAGCHCQALNLSNFATAEPSRPNARKGHNRLVSSSQEGSIPSPGTLR